MRGVYLPGGRAVDLRDVAAPEPGFGQVLLRMRASTICGSDLRAIYREHLGTGAEAYQGVIAGHEPCGEVVAVGPGCVQTEVGDRVVVYHISGCGLCSQCRSGYRISCTSPVRRAYGWQRDGGHADLLLADEADLVALPDELSFVDGACVACGFGTAHEGLCRAGRHPSVRARRGRRGLPGGRQRRGRQGRGRRAPARVAVNEARGQPHAAGRLGRV